MSGLADWFLLPTQISERTSELVASMRPSMSPEQLPERTKLRTARSRLLFDSCSYSCISFEMSHENIHSCRFLTSRLVATTLLILISRALPHPSRVAGTGRCQRLCTRSFAKVVTSQLRRALRSFGSRSVNCESPTSSSCHQPAPHSA